MKKLFVVLVMLVSGLGYSQTKGSHNDTLEKWYNENRLAVEKEFVRLIDSARSNITLEKRIIYRSVDGFSEKSLRTILKTEKKDGNFCQVVKYEKGNKIRFIIVTKSFSAVNIKYDSILSLASNHHAQYLVEVGEKYVSHDENKEYVSNFLILERPKDRVNYYCENKVYIRECLTTYKTNVKLKFSLPVSINSVTVKDFAYYFFKTFKDSKSHWAILMMENDIDYIGCSLQMDFNGSFISFVVLTGNDKNNKYGDLYVEGLSIDD